MVGKEGGVGVGGAADARGEVKTDKKRRRRSAPASVGHSTACGRFGHRLHRPGDLFQVLVLRASLTARHALETRQRRAPRVRGRLHGPLVVPVPAESTASSRPRLPPPKFLRCSGGPARGGRKARKKRGSWRRRRARKGSNVGRGSSSLPRPVGRRTAGLRPLRPSPALRGPRPIVRQKPRRRLTYHGRREGQQRGGGLPPGADARRVWGTRRLRQKRRRPCWPTRPPSRPVERPGPPPGRSVRLPEVPPFPVRPGRGRSGLTPCLRAAETRRRQVHSDGTEASNSQVEGRDLAASPAGDASSTVEAPTAEDRLCWTWPPRAHLAPERLKPHR